MFWSVYWQQTKMNSPGGDFIGIDLHISVCCYFKLEKETWELTQDTIMTKKKKKKDTIMTKRVLKDNNWT